MKPAYCTRPEVSSCQACDQSNGFLDCRGNPDYCIGDNIRRTRVEAGLSLNEVAIQADVSEKRLLAYENSEIVPSMTDVLAIAKVIGIRAGELLM